MLSFNIHEKEYVGRTIEVDLTSNVYQNLESHLNEKGNILTTKNTYSIIDLAQK